MARGSSDADGHSRAVAEGAAAPVHDPASSEAVAPPWRCDADEWVVELYEELRKLASLHLSGFPRSVTLQPTVLVHRALVRLWSSPGRGRGWNDRNHFYHAASMVMRRELLTWVRKRRARQARAAVHPLLEATAIPALRVVGEDRLEALEAALRELERDHPRWARVVNCRWFLGMTVAQTADALGVGERTVAADWRFAQAWLRTRVDRCLGT